MSTFAPFLVAVKNRIIENSTYITNSNNVLLTNNVDILSLPDSAFPRVEIFVDVAQGEGYESQRTIQWKYQLSFSGYIKRIPVGDGSESLWTEDDFLSIWSFGEEAMATVMGSLDESKKYPHLYSNFLFFSGSPLLTASCEIIPNISMFNGFVEAIFQKEDTNG